MLLGREKLERLRRSRVLVVGLGGVGAYAAEMIARAGVGHMTVADADVVSESNINRQLIALHSTVGRPKTEVMAERLRDINPDIDLRTVARFIKDEETYALLDSDRFDYVVDAIDTLSPKLALIIGAMERGIPLVSSMGAGAKTDPARMEIADISATHHCPLAHMLRKRLHKAGIRSGFTAVFSPEHSGDYIFTLSANDGFRLIIDGDTLANFWYDSQARANNEICFTAEAGKQYDVVVEYVQGGGEGHLRFDVGRYETVDPEALARSIEEETVIFSGGITPRLEGEEMRVDYPGFRGGDRTAIELPQVQSDIIAALKKAGKRVILVLNSGSAIGLEREMPYVDAVLQAWYPGQAGGTAVADVLFGDYNPAGRLPITFYKNTAQLPDFEDYSMKGRTYRYMQEEPLFPFGHGLSYTTFAYGKASLDKKARAGKENRLTILLTNSGTRDGEEVIQVYVRNLQDPDGPEKSLRAFKRVSLRAGETRKITVDLRPSTFDFYDPENGTVWSKPGKYEILYGGTSDDKELKKLSVTLK